MGRDALVTGATGFIGSHLCRELADRGWEVSALYRRESSTDHLEDLDAEWVRADVLDRDAIGSAVAGHARVFHLAGVGLLDADEETVRKVNVEGTENVLDACREAGVERVVFTSTAGTRRSAGVADETDLARPIGAYQESKRRAERLVDRENGDGIETVTAHPTSVFGAGDTTFTARLLDLATDPKMIAYLPGGVSVVGVRDVVDGLVAAMERGTPGEHYILGGQNRPYGDIVEVIARYAGERPPPFEIPRPAIHAMGPIAGVVNRAFGTRVFPVNAEMARLVTQSLYYTSEKAERELGYSYEPLEAHVDAALNWHANGRR